MANRKQKIAKAKQRQKLQQKKTKKRQVAMKHAAMRQTLPLLPRRIPLALIETPEGFHPATVTHAIFEFGWGIMEAARKVPGDERLNSERAFGAMIRLWNYCISSNGYRNEQEDLGAILLDTLPGIMGISRDEAVSFLSEMKERRRWLLPDEIQPASNSDIMFVRNEKRHGIPDFREADLPISNVPHVPTPGDREMVAMLNDLMEVPDESPDQKEMAFKKTLDKTTEQFSVWLKEKGIDEHKDNFIYAVEAFARFAYIYDESYLLCPDVEDIDWFFTDYVFRRTYVEPEKLVQWPVAIKLFYDFLWEIEPPGAFDGWLRMFYAEMAEWQENFRDLLKKRYA